MVEFERRTTMMTDDEDADDPTSRRRRRDGGRTVNLDLAALRALEREREIPFETILAAIESALLTAYRHTDGASSHARIEVDRKTGSVAVIASETDDDGTIIREFDDTPHDFGRIAAMTAKQVILQRLREATDEVHFGEYVGRDGDLVTGVIQAHEGRSEKGIVTIDLGKIEAMLPQSEQVPGELYEHGMRIKCIVVHVAKGFRGPQVTLSRTHPNLVRRLFALEVPEIADGTVEITAIAREAGHRSKIAVYSTAARREREGRLHRPDGPARPRRDERVARREDRHHRLGRGSGDVRRKRALAGEGARGRGGRPGDPDREGDRPRLSAVAGDRPGRAECPTCRPVDRLADRHPLRCRARASAG